MITNELKRVLKKTGTMFWNHGDSYSTRHTSGTTDAKTGWKTGKLWQGIGRKEAGRAFGGNIPDKCLMLQNYRLVQKMIDEQGWILRNMIIWYKPNCMPSSVKDRFTVDYEPVFFFTKNKKYWFEQQFEPHIWAEKDKRSQIKGGKLSKGKTATGQYATTRVSYGIYGRSKRCVWKIPTKHYKEAHFATYPPALIEPMIKAGCPKNGLVLDPFLGSGTTASVARNLNRNYIGIELNKIYIKLAEKRLAQNKLDL